MTKVTILGEQPQETKKKPIELVWYINENGQAETPVTNRIVSGWTEIELICKNYRNRGLDLIFCINKGRNGASDTQQGLYLGYFNDGIL